MEKKFAAFEENDEFTLCRGEMIIYSSLILLMFFLCLHLWFDIDSSPFDIIVSIFLVFFVPTNFMINFYEIEKENGKYTGDLIFTENFISINNEQYYLDEISKIENFSVGDIRGARNNTYLKFCPQLSNGLSNKLSIKLKNNTTIQTNFLQTWSNKLTDTTPLVKLYYKKGLISWYHLISLLNMSDYEEIQALKKELNA